jgi:methionine biosynthesis protein MetW
MFNFPNARKPDFTELANKTEIFKDYWNDADFTMRNKLMERERIFLNWIKDGSSVVSLGCGNSRLLYELQKEKNCRVYGVDFIESIVEAWQGRGIEAVVGDLSSADFDLKLLFDVKKFDYIILSEVIHEIVFPEKLLENIKSMGDNFIFSLPNSAFYRYRLALLFNGRFFTQWVKHPAETLRFWSHIDFLEWLEAMDYKVVEAKASNGFNLGPLPIYNLWKNLFGHQICYLCNNN